MATTTALSLLKTNLGLLTAPSDVETLLCHFLDAAAVELTNAGAPVDENDPSDLSLLIMYAAWLYRKRDTELPMPPMLRYAINNHKVRKAVPL